MDKVYQILVIEDNPELGLAYTRTLKKAGYKTILAETCSDGIEQFQSNQVDLVLIDVILPDGSGLELATRFRQNGNSDTFIVLMSGEIQEADIQTKALENGADGYLLKPIKNSELAARIDAFIRHKRTIDQYKRSEANMRKIAQRNADAIIVTNFDGNVVFANPAAGRLFRTTPQDLIDTKFGYPLVIGEYTEIDIVGNNRTIVTAEMRVVELEWDEEPAILSSIRDISERKEFERLILQQKKRAEESEKMKSAFLANMSHEIRTPLNAVIGFSEILEDEELDDELKIKYYSLIRKNGDSLLHLISDILDISSLESGKITLYPQMFNVKSEIEDLKTVYDSFIKVEKKKGLTIELDFRQLKDPIIYTDLHRFKQVLSNLIHNSVKFSESGQIIVEISDVDPDYISMSVSDSGLGMPEAQLQMIFEPFGRVELNKEKKVRGTGLGLAIVKKILENLNGTISVKSILGEGSTFTVMIPRNL